MRLICPNCDAQYEVDADIIPVTGRDVQCSNCGHTWFQRHADPTPTLLSEGATQKADAAHSKEAAASVHPDTEDEAGHVDAPRESIAKPRATPSPSSTPNTGLTDSVRDILRSEVEFHQSTQGTQTNTAGTQPDVTSSESSPELTKQSLRERMARLHALEIDEAETGAAAAAATLSKRRDLLPDIEDIKSSLNPALNHAADDAADELPGAVQKSGFRAVFLTMIVFTCILVGLYIAAPFLAKKVPALQPALEMYVSAANAFRGWLWQAMETASQKINAFLSQANEKA